MLDFSRRTSLETTPGVDRGPERACCATPRSCSTASPDLPGAQEMAAAPAWLRDTLLFSYLQGAAFCLERPAPRGPEAARLRLHHRSAALDRADPAPREVAHPAGRPHRPAPPGPRGGAAGVHARRPRGRWGSWACASFCAKGSGTWTRAAAAADGWGGDRFAVYEKERREGRRPAGRLDQPSGTPRPTPASSAARSPGCPAGGSSPPDRAGSWRSRRGTLPDERWAAVRARLAAVPAEPPANRTSTSRRSGATPPPAAPSPAGGR